MNKKTFYILSITWGLPLTLIGLIVAAVLICIGYKPKKWGCCYYFEVGENWGGLELGIIFLTNKNPTKHIRNHEHGHAIQNCYLGVFMPFVICIPSAIRYWYRTFRTMAGLENKTKYDDIWFERTATELGKIYASMWN